MGSSQHNLPHQAIAFWRGLDVLTSAEISPSRLLNGADIEKNDNFYFLGFIIIRNLI